MLSTKAVIPYIHRGWICSPHPVKVLLVTALSGDDRSSILWQKNLTNLAENIDVFFCFYGEKPSALMDKKVVGTSHSSGCKAEHWYNVPIETIRKYSYVWLCDEDIEVTNFDWKSFERIMIETNAIVIQPSIKAAKGVKRSTDIRHLKYDTKGENVMKVPRTEVQSCFVSTKIWPILYERLKNSDRRSDYGMDTCWDDLARLLHKFDVSPPPLVTRHLYVEHHDFRSMNNGICKRKCIDNCKPLTQNEVNACKFIFKIHD